MTVSHRRTIALFAGASLPHAACVASLLLPLMSVGVRFKELEWISDIFILAGLLTISYCWIRCWKHPPRILWIATMIFFLTLPLHALLSASHGSGCVTGTSLTYLWWWITSPIGLRYDFHQHFF